MEDNFWRRRIEQLTGTRYASIRKGFHAALSRWRYLDIPLIEVENHQLSG